ncbi:ABC transporter permease [uncultured Gulosibacter sp.]|uniref:ABC transporter permease n=1 Tax=uncultured Gulosibacter sp. TaxID=1339167 RepID=UPI00288BB054|nr:ABC transporter permease [uncultured Gulosibacter sp.]
MTAPVETTAASDATGLSTVQGAMLVAKREIVTTARSKAFIWGLIMTVAVIVLLIGGQKLLGSIFASAAGVNPDETVVTTLDAEQLQQAGINAEKVDSVEQAIEKVRSGDASSAIVSGAEANGVTVYDDRGQQVQIPSEAPAVVLGKDGTPVNIIDALTVTPPTAMIDKPDTELSPLVTYVAGVFLGMLFMVGVVGYAARIAQNVVEEKASRIVELLLVTVRPRTILAGKVIGGTMLALVQVVAVVVAAFVTLAATGQLSGGDLGDPAALTIGLIWFAVLFVVGFMLFAALYAGVASTVSRPEDVPSATSVLTFVAMAPYLLVIMFNTNQPVLTWLSYIPLSSPVAMPLRLFAGTAAWWEPLLALLVLAATTVLFLWMGARIYENTVLRSGRVKLKDALQEA